MSNDMYFEFLTFLELFLEAFLIVFTKIISGFLFVYYCIERIAVI